MLRLLLVPALMLLAIAVQVPAEEDAAPVAKADSPADTTVSPADLALMAAARLADIDFQRHLSLVVADVNQPDETKRVLAIRELGLLQDGASAPLLIPLLEPGTNSTPILIAACETLADIGATTASSPMLRLLGHSEPEVRAVAQKSLTRLQSMGASSYQSRGNDTDDGLRASAVTNLGTLKRVEAAPILIAALRSDSRPHVRRMAAISLGKLGDHANASPVIDALCDADPGVRRYAAEALVQMHAVEAIPYLIIALEANVVPTHLNRCLRILSGQDFGFDPRSNVLERTEAIECWNDWWALNAKTLTGK